LLFISITLLRLDKIAAAAAAAADDDDDDDGYYNKDQSHLALGGIAASIFFGEGEVVWSRRWYRWIGRC